MKVAGIHLSPPATNEEIDRLRRALPVGVPEDYFKFLRGSNGAEVWFDEVDYERDGFDSIRLSSVDDTLFTHGQEWLRSALPHLLVIGSDAGGQLLAFDMGSDGWPIVMHLPGWSEAEGALHVADSITELAAKYGLHQSS